MSRRTKQSAASRRTWRGEQQQSQAAVEFGFAESQRVVSNPIFYCGGNGPSQPKPLGDQLRCVYDPGTLGALVHDPAAAGSSGIGNGKPLPLPPCRAQHRGARVGPAVVVGGPHGRFLRTAQPHHQDPFLAAYVACSKSSGGDNVKRHREKKTRWRKCDKGGVVRACGIWDGWAASAMYAGAAMSCKNACAVADVRGRGAPVPAAKEKAEAEVEAGPTLDLSWAPVVLSARAMERRREQR